MDDEKSIVFVSESPADTIGFGEKIGASLAGGEVVFLIGQLGSGKTHLIKGIAKGAGFSDSDEVTSPTFVLVNEYAGDDMRLEVYHIDAYRIDDVGEFEMLGFDDMCHEGSVVLIEWADKVASVLEDVDRITINLSHVSENERCIEIKNCSSKFFDSLK
ncbi:MAG: tRNA (adenosine(37)-N6)-threonylcarbamoyltransferase complex ATPase subunit type 1 TsaE [Planctomycetes bacterium]|nr:tRNA (adenosine(37)-N6)-threonylcarbamoyltransferase complex ATPase subunit type 1 TsaE [Planctomycetota bacterium]